MIFRLWICSSKRVNVRVEKWSNGTRSQGRRERPQTHAGADGTQREAASYPAYLLRGQPEAWCTNEGTYKPYNYNNSTVISEVMTFENSRFKFKRYNNNINECCGIIKLR